MLNEINKLIFAVISNRNDYIKKYSIDMETPTESIDYELVNIVKSCSISINNGFNNNKFLYRGVSASSAYHLDDIAYISPNKNPTNREPLLANESLMYLYENLPFFKGWPNRYKSMFFSDGFSEAVKFGDYIYLGFPSNASKIASVPNDFNYNGNLLNMFGSFLGEMSYKLYKYLLSNKVIKPKWTGEGFTESNIKDIIKFTKLIKENQRSVVCSIIDELIYDPGDTFFADFDSNKMYCAILQEITSEIQALQSFDASILITILLKKFNEVIIKSNDYVLYNTKSLGDSLSNDSNSLTEYWTDDPCLLMSYNLYDENVDEIKAIINNILKN